MNQPYTEIWKFALDIHEREQRHMLPYVVELLGIQMQNGVPVLWAKVCPETVRRTYKILRFMSGEPISGEQAYLGTVQLSNGIVLHYFTGGNL